MNSKYNIPQYTRNMQTSYANYNRPNNGDRFFGGGFLGPFILGGITGGLIANNRPYGYGYPQVVYYPPVPVPIQQPYATSNNYYYY